jgi:glycine dehydrogenase
MKLNATAEMFPVSWPEFAKLHPFAPESQWTGYRDMCEQLERGSRRSRASRRFRCSRMRVAGRIRGAAGDPRVSPVTGEWRAQDCLIPQSAHGTNPASAVMVGFKVVPVATLKDGDIDVADLRAKAEAHKDDLAALMVTYPSTHGVFETTIRDICDIVHANGGQVYMDGANMNAQVGLCRPGTLARTFAI